MRVAFPLIGGNDWTGGCNYLLNLIRALATHYPEVLTPVLFFGDDVAVDEIAPFARLSGVEMVSSSAFDRDRRLHSLALSLAFGADSAIKRLLEGQRIDVVFEAAQFFGARLGIPAIAWLPDFQHRHLPRLFSPFARFKRELGFRAQIATGRTVMLSSNDARKDCERFYPATTGHTHAVHFAVPPPAVMSIDAARSIADGYGLPKDFFYMPNQFWLHKNHFMVAEALALIRKQGNPVVVAASGNTFDPRDPHHYGRLLKRIRTLGVEADFRLLGLIPYEHLAALMQASSALLNPSLFEGWSTTVEEARALGVPLILSDLAVHREQACDGASYFARSSATALAEVLTGFRPLLPAERDRRGKAAAADAEHRVSAFAKQFVAVARRCHEGEAS
jgi:glycosyltransferase involved in cell wall biosynthesis